MISFESSYRILGTILVSSFICLWIGKRKNTPLPPGPKGYPIVGNAYDLPRTLAWLTYAEWAKTYGDVFSFNVFGHTTIILNSSKAITELFEKRSTNYSDRPRMVMANELMGWDWDFVHMPYTGRWRRHRRVFHQYFQPRNLSAQHNAQRKAAVNLLEQLSSSPEKFFAHIRQYILCMQSPAEFSLDYNRQVGSIVLRAAYGYNVETENDFYIDLVHKAVQPVLNVVHAGTYFVEYLPFLKHVPAWLPGADFKRKAIMWSQGTRNVIEIPFNYAKQEIAAGTALNSFVHDNLEKIKTQNLTNFQEEEDIIKNCAGIIYLAGSDTTASLLLGWMLAMSHFPDAQRKGQAEIDKVVGTTRLPNFNDRQSMPYIEAMILEAMRWHVTAPLAVPHRVMHEDEYDGYRIPAGATVTANTWAILHNEELYPEPSKFKPERFLDQKEENISFISQPDPSVIGAFGYGRRVCPGRHLALDTAWIIITNILATYSISNDIDENGNVIEPKIEFGDGVVSQPKSYKARITPRSNSIFDLIESARVEISS